jgi:hypothetical protein
MISTFDYIQKYPLRAKQLLGISYDQFTNLVNCAKQCHEEKQLKLEQSKIRIHSRGGGRLTGRQNNWKSLFYKECSDSW